MDKTTFQALQRLLKMVGEVQDGEPYILGVLHDYYDKKYTNLRSAHNMFSDFAMVHNWVANNVTPHHGAIALGSMTSDKKAAAARRNGKKGGYPKGRSRKFPGTRNLPLHSIHRGETKEED